MTHSAGVTLRARTGFALLAVTTLLLTSCTTTSTGTQSADTTQTPSTTTDTTQSAPQMSGDYEINAEGKLLKPTTTPTPPPPTPPDTLTQDTPQAAQDFAHYFVAVAEHAWNTGNSTQLRSISTPQCDMCTNMADAIDQVTAAGGWTIDTAYRVTEIEPPIPHPDDVSTLVFLVHVETATATTYDGTRIRHPEPNAELIELHVLLTQDGWKAVGGTGADDPDA